MNRDPLLESESGIPLQRESSAAHATEYLKIAALLRRRALQPHRTEDERTELQRRADWYERRAVVKRHGGIMPPELRTPLESLELVDELRRRLADVADLARQLSSNELEAFCLSLKVDTNERWSICSGESMMVGLEQWIDLALVMLDLLGVHQNAENGEYVYLPFVMRTAAVR